MAERKRIGRREAGPFIRWVREHSPTREQLARNRFIRPFAGRVLASELWRFTRRSVPRGAALGMVVGIFVMIPGLQIAVAALLALPFRANIPVAAAATFTSNPLTTPFILLAAVMVGNNVFGLTADPQHFRFLVESGAGIEQWSSWLASDAAPAMLGGLAIIALTSAVIVYVVADWFWRYRIARKWRRRGAVYSEAD